jgi:hypothetical protein
VYARTPDTQKYAPTDAEYQSHNPPVRLTNSMTPTADLSTGVKKKELKEEAEHEPLRLQSAHNLFSGRLTSSRRVCVCRSAVTLSNRDIEVEVVPFQE